MYSFKDQQEAASTGKTRTSTGIHDFIIENVETVKVPGKDDKPDWEKTVVTFKCVKTHDGVASEGTITPYDILFPNSQEAFEKTSKRIIHIFNKTAGSNKIEDATKFINSWNIANINDFTNQFIKFKGKTVRLKIVANQEKTYPMIPLYYSDYAEPTDVPFEQSKLRYFPASESVIAKDESRIEKSSTATATPNSAGSVADGVDDLPF